LFFSSFLPFLFTFPSICFSFLPLLAASLVFFTKKQGSKGKKEKQLLQRLFFLSEAEGKIKKKKVEYLIALLLKA
jgi:hypothetical protein